MRLATAFLVLSMLGGFGSSQAAGHGAAPPPRTSFTPIDARDAGVLTGGVVRTAKTDPDTVYLMGGPNRTDGKFQLATSLAPDWQGWIPVDRTVLTDGRWHVSEWNGRATLDPSFSPNHTMWCGELLTPCPGGDPPQGYTNGYNEWLDWYGVVTNNAIATNVTVTCVLNNDSEPGYDLLRFEVRRGTGWQELINYSGINTLVNFSQTFSVGAADYDGAGHDQIHLRFHGTSDSGWSDGDCRWPTWGHSNLDNIQVMTDNGVSTYDDFEGGPQHWNLQLPPACGNFGQVWPRLADLDPCASDDTPVVAFIDDGVVVPGTGGSTSIDWTYGPGGYVFNCTGGLRGPAYRVENDIWSPALAWPGGRYTGCRFDFSLYEHLPLTNGIFAIWRVRASTDGGTTWGQWQDSDYLYYGTPAVWADVHNDVSAKLPSNRTHVQLALGGLQYGWGWYPERDSTPAPYFDNVRCLAYALPGPAISAREIDLFQDNFPAGGIIDRVNLGDNSVRLDMAANISPRGHLRNDPGDSIVATVAVGRAGAALAGPPKLYYKLKPNPLFDAYRTSGVPNQGYLAGDTTKTGAGAVVANSWRWDLPDSSFFFPGDVLHYYIEAQDDLAGDIVTTRLPPDTAGFSFFMGNVGYKTMLYLSAFTARALPSLNSAAAGDQPRILFWNDAAGRGGDDEWGHALYDLGILEGLDWDYDVYTTKGASSGVGDGLGGRATGAQLAGYNVMLYTSGDLGNFTLSNGDFSRSDPGNDLAVMTAWLGQGGKHWFCTGDDLAYDLGKSGSAATTFRNTFLPMTCSYRDVRPLIQNQINPVVNPVAGNPIGLTQTYIAYGGCPTFNKFDAVQATGTTSIRIATFQELSGSPYPYAAALYVPNAGGYGDDIVFMPYDLQYICKIPNTAKGPATLEKRAQVLREILNFFGVPPSFVEVGVGDTPAAVFIARSYPNPFNPSTKIEYSLPREGRLSIRIYNVRGELVRTLLDQPMQAGPSSVTWQGDDDRGRPVGSGVYFYQVKSGDGEILNKVTLVK